MGSGLGWPHVVCRWRSTQAFTTRVRCKRASRSLHRRSAGGVLELYRAGSSPCIAKGRDQLIGLRSAKCELVSSQIGLRWTAFGSRSTKFGLHSTNVDVVSAMFRLIWGSCRPLLTVDIVPKQVGFEQCYGFDRIALVLSQIWACFHGCWARLDQFNTASASANIRRVPAHFGPASSTY